MCWCMCGYVRRGHATVAGSCVQASCVCSKVGAVAESRVSGQLGDVCHAVHPPGGCTCMRNITKQATHQAQTCHSACLCCTLSGRLLILSSTTDTYFSGCVCGKVGAVAESLVRGLRCDAAVERHHKAGHSPGSLPQCWPAVHSVTHKVRQSLWAAFV